MSNRLLPLDTIPSLLQALSQTNRISHLTQWQRAVPRCQLASSTLWQRVELGILQTSPRDDDVRNRLQDAFRLRCSVEMPFLFMYTLSGCDQSSGCFFRPINVLNVQTYLWRFEASGNTIDYTRATSRSASISASSKDEKALDSSTAVGAWVVVLDVASQISASRDIRVSLKAIVADNSLLSIRREQIIAIYSIGNCTVQTVTISDKRASVMMLYKMPEHLSVARGLVC